MSDYTNADVITVLMIVSCFFATLWGYSHGRHR